MVMNKPNASLFHFLLNFSGKLFDINIKSIKETYDEGRTWNHPGDTEVDESDNDANQRRRREAWR